MSGIDEFSSGDLATEVIEGYIGRPVGAALWARKVSATRT
jgi:hypothetical protein